MLALRRFAAVLALLGLAAAPAAAQEAPPIVLIAPEGEAGSFWEGARKGAEAAAESLRANLEVASPESAGGADRAAALRAALAAAPAGIIAAIPDADLMAPALRQAAEAGVPVVTIGEGFDVARQLGARLAVGQDEFEAGRAAGEAMRRLGAKSAVCLTGDPPTLSQDTRCKGVAEAFDRPVALLPADGGADAVEAAVRQRLESDAAVDAVIAASGGPSGEAAVVAVAALGAESRVRVAAFDPSPGFMVALAGGQAAFAIDQQPRLQGWLAMALLTAHARTGEMPIDNIRTGPRIVTPEEARAAGQ